VSDEWCIEGKLDNGGVKIRHVQKRCVFDVWQQDGEMRAVFRQGAAGNDLFDEAKAWFKAHGNEHPDLL
jgi:hypothetical protein